MPKHLVTALAFLLIVGISGCDLTDEDPEEELFNGSWQIVEVESENTDYSSIVLGRYTSAVIAFVADEDDFSLFLDVADSPEDVLIQGEFDVDSGDEELTLFSSAFPGAFDFNYVFENEDRVILWTDDDDPVLFTIFGIDLNLDEVILVMDRD